MENTTSGTAQHKSWFGKIQVSEEPGFEMLLLSWWFVVVFGGVCVCVGVGGVGGGGCGPHQENEPDPGRQTSQRPGKE